MTRDRQPCCSHDGAIINIIDKSAVPLATPRSLLIIATYYNY